MGLTFRLAGSYTPTPIPGPCPACGVAAHEGRGHACDACQGYGGDTAEQFRQEAERAQREVDVCMGSAAIVLRWLGQSEHFEGGEMDASMALVALACVQPACDVTAQRASRGVYLDANGVGRGARVVEAGYDVSRLESLRARITKLAERAAFAGVAVEWV